MHDLIANREILVVGGSSGMGLATARQCLSQNGRVKIVGRNRDRLDSAIAYLGGPDERIVSIQADASTEEGRAKIFAGV
ncbi:MAG: SDR family NAD(P)-dependent oxidoreductase, partial [Leptospiraceae bacterium]|nr:SDR family NAD(P)-dependent oxidoreductase [Leptospiraceae bacterium]